MNLNVKQKQPNKMKRHKRIYTQPIENHPKAYQIVMVWRNPKKRSRIRKTMYWAWQYQSDQQYLKKYDNQQ